MAQIDRFYGEYKQFIVSFSLCAGVVENNKHIENDWHYPLKVVQTSTVLSLWIT